MSSIKTKDQIPVLEAQALHSFVAEKTKDLHGEQGATRQERLATMAEAVQVPVAESVEVEEESNMVMGSISGCQRNWMWTGCRGTTRTH